MAIKLNWNRSKPTDEPSIKGLTMNLFHPNKKKDQAVDQQADLPKPPLVEGPPPPKYDVKKKED